MLCFSIEVVKNTLKMNLYGDHDSSQTQQLHHAPPHLLLLLALIWDITTPQHNILNRQVGRKSSFPQQKVGREYVFPTNLVGHRKSSRQRPFPTNFSLPTDSLSA
jgi:hypothetical protein